MNAVGCSLVGQVEGVLVCACVCVCVYVCVCVGGERGGRGQSTASCSAPGAQAYQGGKPTGAEARVTAGVDPLLRSWAPLRIRLGCTPPPLEQTPPR